jgi:hypothetical protein
MGLNLLKELSLPDDYYKDSKGQVDLVKISKLEWYTGFLPREIQLLNTMRDFDKFERARTGKFRERALQLYSDYSLEKRRVFNDFLVKVLVPKYGGHAYVMYELGPFYDKGLFYQNSLGFEVISGPARNALLPLLSEAIKQNLKPVNSISVS